MPAMLILPHHCQNRSLRSIVFISTNKREKIHKSCMNHSGPIPTKTQEKYRAIEGMVDILSEMP